MYSCPTLLFCCVYSSPLTRTISYMYEHIVPMTSSLKTKCWTDFPDIVWNSYVKGVQVLLGFLLVLLWSFFVIIETLTLKWLTCSGYCVSWRFEGFSFHYWKHFFFLPIDLYQTEEHRTLQPSVTGSFLVICPKSQSWTGKKKAI